MDRKFYAVLAGLLGLPTLATGGLFALTAFMFGGLMLTQGESDGAPVLLAGLGGLLGLTAWANLSWRYWREGGPGLRQAPRWAWLGLAAGCVAAVWLLATASADYSKYAAEGAFGVGMLAVAILPRGPLLLPLALYLALAALWPRHRAAAAGSG